MMMANASDKVQDLIMEGVHIARISTVPFFVVTQLRYQIKTLASTGARVTVVTSDGPELKMINSMQGVSVFPIDIPRSIAPWRDLLALIRLWLFFKTNKVDISHSTTPKAGLLVAFAAFMAGVPIRLHTFTGQPWVEMYGIKRLITKTSDWLIGKINTHCYADSHSQRLFLIEQGVMDSQKLSVIGAGSLAGIDTERFNDRRYSEEQKNKLRKTLGIPLETEILLFMGRITMDKGVLELIEAFKRLKSDGSLANLVFVGPFDSESGATGRIIKDSIEGIQDIHFVGYTDCPEKYLSIADILCLPSYREGFGTVVIEAAAMGVPSVGTNIYGLCDAIEDGETGILVNPKDSDSLYYGLSTLLKDSERRIRMGQSARERAIRLFDADLFNQEVVREYKRMIKQKGLTC